MGGLKGIVGVFLVCVIERPDKLFILKLELGHVLLKVNILPQSDKALSNTLTLTREAQSNML